MVAYKSECEEQMKFHLFILTGKDAYVKQTYHLIVGITASIVNVQLIIFRENLLGSLLQLFDYTSILAIHIVRLTQKHGHDRLDQHRYRNYFICWHATVAMVLF